jgi:digeranylgeranylglycerophospholipid reductase
VFEKWLASKAITAGVRYMVKTQALGLKRSENGCTVKTRFLDETFNIRAKMVMAADGVESLVGRWAGLKAINRLRDYHSCLQYEMAGVNVDHSLIHVFFGKNIAPKGYAWIFPKKFAANVGLGILSKESGAKRAVDYLQGFIGSHPEIFEKASPIEINAGGVPVNHVTAMVTDNVMLIGDAAQMVHPLHGGGIIRAIQSAKEAARIAQSAFEEKDFSARRLRDYEAWWDAEYGEKMKRLMKVRSFLERMEDKDFELLAEILEGEDILSIIDAKVKFFIKKLLTKPSMASLVKKYLMS